jgi:hypothetical protein
LLSPVFTRANIPVTTPAMMLKRPPMTAAFTGSDCELYQFFMPMYFEAFLGVRVGMAGYYRYEPGYPCQRAP